MPSITIKADFICGTEFKDAVIEARQFARRMDVAYVNYSFNGVDVHIGQNADEELACKDYADGKKAIIHS